MKIKTVNDYVDEVHKKFDKLERDEIRKILNYGFKMFNYINYYGGDVMLKDTTNLKFLMYTGKLFKKFEMYYKYYIKKFSTKLRMLDKRKKEQWDGYYYFGLTDVAYEEYESQKEDSLIFMENILLFRLLDEVKTHNQYKHFFKVKYPEYKGYCFFMKHYEIEESDLIEL